MEARAKVEYLFICLELHSRIGYIWMKNVLPPAIFSVSLGIIICMFVSIRHTELPIYLYLVFPYVGITDFLIIFWMSYDIVLITRDFEYIRGQFLCHDAPYLVQKTKWDRKHVMMRARAMRVVEFPLGDFADFSFNLPIAVWDEVVNQVLFLLSFG